MKTEDIEIGQFVFLTKPNCPACIAFKENDNVQDALDNGDAVEVGPDDEAFEEVMEDAGIEVFPGVAERTADGFENVGA